MTHKDRILKVARGEMVDKIPYVPRLDLWHNANARAGTLPARHQERNADEIARAEGWALHKIVPEFDKPAKPENTLHRGRVAICKQAFYNQINLAENKDYRIPMIYATLR